MIVVNNAAVRADRDVDSGAAVIFVARPADVDQRRRLPAANAFRFSGDADRAAADSHLDKVGARLRQEKEALPIDDVARADLDLGPIFLMDIVESNLLPLGIAFRGIDAERVNPRVQERRNPLGVVAGIDPGADAITFVGINELIPVLLVLGVVLAKNHVPQPPVFVDQRQHIELALPNDVIGLRQGCIGVGVDELIEGGHKFGHRRIKGHTAHTVVPAGDDAHEPPRRHPVLGDRHRRMPRLFFEGEHLSQRRRRQDIGIAGNEA